MWQKVCRAQQVLAASVRRDAKVLLHREPGSSLFCRGGRVVYKTWICRYWGHLKGCGIRMVGIATVTDSSLNVWLAVKCWPPFLTAGVDACTASLCEKCREPSFRTAY